MKRSRFSAFTLAEVLIALGLLGILAVFVIPKMMQNTQYAHRDTVLKETIAEINKVVYAGMLSGELPSTMPFHQYFIPKFNTLKVCNDAVADGCWNGISYDPNGGATAPYGGVTPTNAAMVLPNGVMVLNISKNPLSLGQSIMLDFNGNEPPHSLGKDQLVMYISVKDHYMQCGTSVEGNPLYFLPGGRLLPGYVYQSYLLWQRLYNSSKPPVYCP